MNSRSHEYRVQIENSSGFFGRKKISEDEIPETMINDKPIELQEVTFSKQGNGHRNAYNYGETISFDFAINKPLPSIATKFHKHDYFELILVASGKLEMQTESKLCLLNEGDVCILNRFTKHAEFFQPGQKVFYIAITPAYMTEWRMGDCAVLPPLITKLFVKEAESAHRNKEFVIAEHCGEEPSAAMSIAKNIREELETKRPGYQLFIRGLLCRLFYEIEDSRHYRAEYVDLGSGGGFSLAFQAKQLLDGSERKVTKNDLAEKLHYNADYLNQVFKKHFALSISDYGRLAALRRAASLLTKTSSPIHAICSHLGYSNRTHFYKLFREKFGCSPGEYRKSPN